MLQIRSTKYNIECQLNNEEIKKVNEGYDLGFGINDTFKADNHPLFTVSKVSGIICWMFRNFISREENIFRNIILIRIYFVYCTQTWASVSKHRD